MSSRRVISAATAVAAAAVAGTLFAPAAAYATPTDSPLKLALSDISHNDIARGQNVQTLTLTVTNPSDGAQDYTGLVFGIPSGPSPILGSQILFEAAPITAPATDVKVGQEDESAMVGFFPHGGKVSDDFSVPAKASISWKITFGFRQDYPLNDDGITLAFDTGKGSETAHFDVPPQQADGEVTGVFGPRATVAPGKPGETWYEVDNNAGGKFDVPLRTLISVADTVPGLGLDVLSNGHWVHAQNAGDRQWTLPEIPKGFAQGQKNRYDLRFTVPSTPGTGKARDVAVQVFTGLSQGNTTPIVDMEGTVRYDPKQAAVDTPTSSPSPSASASASASATATPSATQSTPAAGAPANAPDTDQLAETGSGDTGLFVGLAALLAAAGAVITASVARRRRNTAA
ncbi:hypothetical protein PV703_29270 [Streptomyces sp. ME01-24h]|nr:hypothetical protein [Streptomyces sp. ME19-03-3]MDX3357322.1 hypothetical protein [Streptomyces sp. ME01-24h]